MRVVIQDNYDKMCKWAANYIASAFPQALLPSEFTRSLFA